MRRLSRRTLGILTAVAFAAPLAWGAAATSAQAETVLRVIPHADLKNIDPIWTTAYITRNHGYMVYDTLFAMDENLQPQPQMVDTWTTSDDGLTWTFVLRDGLKWHDGTPVTAEDCVASLQRWGKRDGMGQKLMDVTASLVAKNEKTIVLTLKEPYGLVLDSIGKISSNVPFMMPKRIAETDPFEQIPEIIGSGPFKFSKDEWVPGSKVVYLKNEDYVPRSEAPSSASGGKIAKVDRVEWIYLPDATTAMNALIAGEVDYYEQVPADLVPILETNEDITVEVNDPLGNQGMLRMNHLHPPFDDPAIRQVVLRAMNQEDYLRAAVGSPAYYKVCHTYYSCGSALETEAGTDIYKSPSTEEAARMLKEAGYDGTPVVMLQPTDVPILNAASLVTAQMLREVGFEVDMQAMDWSTLTSRRAVKDPPADGGWNIFHTWWIGGDIANPVSHVGLSAGGTERAWFGWPDDSKLEDLRDAYSKEPDAAKQKALAEQIQVRAIEIATHGNYGTFFVPVGYRKNVKGLIKSPVQFFWNIAKE
ncbi:MAG: ABC transporter substrate-binding protein [Kiloniellales bacterium]|nr:ABC transporter substrate-binding protein [Kiloniellales bacterium]